MSHVVELRCTDSPRRLFAKMRLEGEKPAYVQPDNLIEIRCRDHPAERTAGKHVYHLFNLAGECVRTEVRDD